jgi:hypothetical protein
MEANMKKVVLLSNQETEIEHPPVSLSLKMYLEKIELLNKEERKILPTVFKTIADNNTVISIKSDIDAERIEKLMKRFNNEK